MQRYDSSCFRLRSAVRGAIAASLLGLLGCPKIDPGTTNATTESASTTGPGASTQGVSDTSTGTTGTPTTGSTSTTAAVTVTAPCETGDCDVTCGLFLVNCFDMMGVSLGCDVFLQDCPEGEKCEATINGGGGAWNATACVPVSGDGVAGDACVAESVAGGLDSCAKGHMCWGVDMDGNGTCVGLCKGSADAPLCPNNEPCTIANEGVLNLCLPSCDPLLQDCAAGAACYPVDDGFTCAPDASGNGGKANDPCQNINACDAGLLCGSLELVGAGCPQGSTGCCTPFCEFPDGACPNPDQSCVQWFDPAMLPPNDPLLLVGACGIPM